MFQKTKLKPHKSVNAALTEIAVKNAPKEISHTISLGSQKRKGGRNSLHFKHEGAKKTGTARIIVYSPEINFGTLG